MSSSDLPRFGLASLSSKHESQVSMKELKINDPRLNMMRSTDDRKFANADMRVSTRSDASRVSHSHGIDRLSVSGDVNMLKPSSNRFPTTIRASKSHKYSSIEQMALERKRFNRSLKVETNVK